MLLVVSFRLALHLLGIREWNLSDNLLLPLLATHDFFSAGHKLADHALLIDALR